MLRWYSVGILGCSSGVAGVMFSCSVTVPLFRVPAFLVL